jgi:hypothetical protein
MPVSSADWHFIIRIILRGGPDYFKRFILRLMGRIDKPDKKDNSDRLLGPDRMNDSRIFSLYKTELAHSCVWNHYCVHGKLWTIFFR